MEIYELRHTYEGADNWFEIGFFTSPEAAHAAADMLMQAPGFRDHPEGFLLVPRNVQTERESLDRIYVASVYDCPRKYAGGNYTEHIAYLGFFETEEEAARAAARFLALNPKEIPGLERYCDAAEYRLNEISAWKEGFTSDCFPSD